MAMSQTEPDSSFIRKYQSDTIHRNQQFCIKEGIKDIEICHLMFLMEIEKLKKIIEKKTHEKSKK
jgi:hypothetical protein